MYTLIIIHYLAPLKSYHILVER